MLTTRHPRLTGYEYRQNGEQKHGGKGKVDLHRRSQLWLHRKRCPVPTFKQQRKDDYWFSHLKELVLPLKR
jgi:hypothetical protein